MVLYSEMHELSYFTIGLITGTALVLSFVLTILVRFGALRFGYVSIPREERWSNRPVALMGGVSVYLSFTILFFVFGFQEFSLIWLGGTIMFLTGLFDDIFELKPIVKFLLQFVAASVLLLGNYSLVYSWPFWVSIPLTYFWIIGITNGLNLIDNMDGLAAGTSMIIALVFSLLAYKLGNVEVAMVSFLLSGAIGGFLLLNYYPARIFMGDSGSLFIGYMMASLPMLFSSQLVEFGGVSALILVIAICILPIYDTSMVTMLRIFKGRSPSQGGKDHTSHRLVFAGLSERSAVHVLYLISIFFGAIVLMFYPNNDVVFYLLFSAGVVGLFYFGLFLSRLDVYGDKNFSKIENIIHKVSPSFKKRIHFIFMLADVILIIVAYTLAHILRFAQWNEVIESLVISQLPIVIITKILILAVFGIYRIVWGYAGVYDLMTLFLGVVSSALVTWFTLSLFIAEGSSVHFRILIIDSLLFFILIAATRFALKTLRSLITVANKGKKRALLYGAGDTGCLALTQIRQAPRLNIKPVGFLDDSPYKINGKVQGLRILGDIDQLSEVIKEYRIDEVLITTVKLRKDRLKKVRVTCAEMNVRCKIFSASFSDLEVGKQTVVESDTLNSGDHENAE